MKKFLAPILVLLVITNLGTAQIADNSGDNSLFFKNEKNSSTLIGFKAVFFEGKTYVNWKVQNEKQDDLFVVFRSTDNAHFEIIDIKQGVGTEIDAPIFYSFIDEDPPTGVSYYKIVKVYSDRSYYQSPVVAVNSQETAMLSNDYFFEWNSVR